MNLVLTSSLSLLKTLKNRKWRT